jgi:hypothetical protein
MLTWNPPTKDASGNALPNNFGGYIIERATQMSGNTIGSNWNWGAIASIPSYISSLNTNVNYFYDYSSSMEIDKYIKAGRISGNVTLQYRIKAIGRKGAVSSTTSPISVAIPVPQRFDANGNPL